ncbi:hypothetical protein CEUSTIGMA_g2970.t1 [Chlamydomonas eustigma]|uniref:Kinesin-like protein n=1 Tax=Chlamydomonas eustigma TaxID=1157962 RepID=A0A250WXH1_9CHLO|nr:hypothetical protein CEUSTIGMA_g2970.t1 [Chlamydomonas eustigma]|eukprot:GAX75527.1 hypothetical protein CEUSTIGMA_g2970.t1 [Chlamydomonas eustigma]
MVEEEQTESTKGSRVQVVVRVRPVLPHELQHEIAVTCSADGNRTQVSLPQRQGDKELIPGSNRCGARSYKFDACLPGNVTQSELFETCGMQELVEAALDGYCVTIFAFGQTGSGKTHTMIGPRLSRSLETSSSTTDSSAANAHSDASEEDGLLPRCIQSAYCSMQQRQQAAEFTVTASCVELYNETVTDLLGKDKSKQLQVRKDARDGFYVDGLNSVPCNSSLSALKAMQRALHLRHTRSHKLNEYSSRSHCMMTFYFNSKEKLGAEGAEGGVKRYGKLVLVDLAGSERLKETGNTDRDAVRETGCINKSLFTLGQVLASLSTNSASGSRPFVPYRDSKLTQLLWEGLRGSGRALMLACLGPTANYAEESLNTLHFASVALRIKAAPVVLLDPQDKLVMDLRNTIKQLQADNRTLAGSLQQLTSGADLVEVIESLPEKLRPPPGTAPPLMTSSTNLKSSSLSSTAPRLAGVRNISADSPWSSASEPQLPPTPISSNVLRLQQVHKTRLVEPDSNLKLNTSRTSLNIQGNVPDSVNAAYRTVSKGVPAPLGSTSPVKRRTGSYGNFHFSETSSPHSPFSPKRSSWTSPQSKSAGRFSNILQAGSKPSRAQQQGHGAASRPYAVQDKELAATAGARGHLQTLGLPPMRGEAMAFPELAAMEAQFMEVLAGAGSTSSSTSPASATQCTEGSRRGADVHAWAPQRSSPKDREEEGQSAPLNEGAPDPGDVLALKWAKKNRWFGTDLQMTEYAYRVHDELVEVQLLDPASSLYYKELEMKVAMQFPEKWGALQKELKAPASRMTSAVTAAASTAFGRALRVSMKDAVPSNLQSISIESTSRPASELVILQGFMNPNFQSSHQVAAPKRFAPVKASTTSHKSVSPVRPTPEDAASKILHQEGRRQKAATSTSRVAILKQLRRVVTEQPQPDSFSPLSYDQMQAEYLKQRALVVEELKRAKEQAEVEKARIMAKIGKALSTSRWRS